MRSRWLLSTVAAIALPASGCDAPEPATESVTLALAFEARSADVDGDGTVSDSVAIPTLEGDPWGAFVAAARDAIGADPADLRVEDVQLRLEPSSTGVTDLAQVFHGPVGLDLRLDGSDHRYDVAEGLLDADALGTEAPLSPRLRWADLTDDDRAQALTGAFDVLLVGQTEQSGGGFRDLGATAALTVEATFVATESL